jgi:hypothetical protein
MTAVETGGGPGPQIPSGGESLVWLENDISWTGIGPETITGITFDVAAGEIWVFDCFIDTDPGAVVPNWTWGGGSLGATIHWEHWYWWGAVAHDGVRDITTFTTTLTDGSVQGRKWYRLRGRVTAAAAPLTMQLAQGAPLSATVTVYAGTYLRYRKLN